MRVVHFYKTASVLFSTLGLLLLAGCPDEATVPAGGDGGTHGIVVLGDGAVQLADGAVVPVDDGGTYLGDGAVALPDGAVVPVDGGYDLGDGAMALPDGAVVPIPDGGIPVGDAGPVLATCDDSAAGMGGCQCSDGIDEPCDGVANGYVDEYDIFCTGPFDDDECSYATGIPGDNRSASHGDRECFFDGDSGLGNDDDCWMLVAPGCDCYGCCEFDINGDDVKEVVRLGGSCDRFEVQGNPQAGQLGGACLAGGTCNGGLFCVTDSGGGSFCAPCEPCANFGGTSCNESTGEGCCWNECDEAAGEVCFGDDPPPPVTLNDGGTAGQDTGGATGTDSGSGTLHDGSTTTGDGATTTGDGATTTGDGATTTGDGATTTGDGATTTGDGATTTGDGATSSGDGGTVSSDGATTGADGASTSGDASQPGDPRCSGLPYCGLNGACPDGTFCYYACCYPIPG